MSKKYIIDRMEIDKITDCWNWKLSKDKDGYGWCSPSSIYKTNKAHRRSYMTFNEVNNEEIKGFHVCHTCDNPSCVNPKHLFLGTALDNKHDQIRKGRDPRGIKHGKSKLSDKDIEIIKNKYSFLLERTRGQKGEITYASVARQYGVTPSTIRFLLKGITYTKGVDAI